MGPKQEIKRTVDEVITCISEISFKSEVKPGLEIEDMIELSKNDNASTLTGYVSTVINYKIRDLKISEMNKVYGKINILKFENKETTKLTLSVTIKKMSHLLIEIYKCIMKKFNDHIIDDDLDKEKKKIRMEDFLKNYNYKLIDETFGKSVSYKSVKINHGKIILENKVMQLLDFITYYSKNKEVSNALEDIIAFLVPYDLFWTLDIKEKQVLVKIRFNATILINNNVDEEIFVDNDFSMINSIIQKNKTERVQNIFKEEENKLGEESEISSEKQDQDK